MKASELFDVKKGELKHKVRSVTDLITYIKTKENKEVSNYSIFLGAGASRSSGISTANELIKGWMLEIYQRFEGKPFKLEDYIKKIDNLDSDEEINNLEPDTKDKLTREQLIKYFETRHSSWFDSTNLYSSLFEKKFDLAPQRRRFVEQEVDGKLPSIGYAYLVSLVENNFFNAIFTTNFDDLLNEAFYQLSSTRPIVCAHDSSVHSISVSSKRPKIIKLHGDYLFENIKSTLRETESLEHNTKDKLVEFCKEYGLIFVGYAGNDRSIMDVIDTLIKNDTYLKNGIYWCVRNDDEINSTLKSLFWKEKVYPVIIDGFDEFFGEIHHNLLPDVKFFNNYRESKQQKIVQKILENKEKFSSETILKDINVLELENEKQDFSYLLSEELDGKDEGVKDRLALRDTKKVIEIKRLMSSSIEQAYIKAYEYLNATTNDLLRVQVLKLLIGMALIQRNYSEFEKWVNQLIEFDKYNFNYYKIKLNEVSDLREKYNLAYSYENLFENESDFYNYIIYISFDMFDSYKEFKNSEFLDKIDQLIQKSLKLEPSLENNAYRYKIILYKKQMSLPSNLKNKEKLGEIENEAFNFIHSLRQNNRSNLNLLNNEVYFVNLFNFKQYAKVLVDDLYEEFNKGNRRSKANIILFLNSIFLNAELEIPIEKKFQFYKDYVKIDDITPIEALATKLQIMYLNGEDLGKLSSLLNELIKKKDFFDEFEKIAELTSLVDTKLLTKIEDVLNSKLHEMPMEDFYNYQHLLLKVKGKYIESIKALEKSYQYKAQDDSYYVYKSYLYLKNESFDKAIELYNDYLASEFDFDSDILTLNTMYAFKMLKDPKYDESKLNVIVSKGEKIMTNATKLVIQNTRAQALSSLASLVKNDPSIYFIVKDWVFLNNDEVNKIKSNITINSKLVF